MKQLRIGGPLGRVLALAFAILLTAAVARADEHEMVRQGSADEGQRLLSLIAGEGNFRLTDVARDGYTLGLADGAGHNIGALYLKLGGAGGHVPRVRSRSFSIEIGSFTPDPKALDTLVRAAGIIAAHDGGAETNHPVTTGRGPLNDFVNVTGGVVVLAILMGLWRRRVTVDIRRPHLVQVIAQTSIFLYWMIYWPGVWSQLPSLAVQIVLAYAADAVFCFARFGSWRLGLSPLPVVLSINLFEWFDWPGLVVCILVAFGSKAYVHRGGRHIFNPSVAGLTVVGLITLFVPGFVHFGGAFHSLSIPPNMAEWVILAALLPQTQFRILPVTLGGALALQATGNPAVVRPAIILAFTLLASDPATSPRGDIGKFLFGAVVGFGLPILSVVMRQLGQPDDFAKVIPVAVANVLVAPLDAIGIGVATLAVSLRTGVGSFIARRWVALAPSFNRLSASVFRPVPNLVFVVTWLLLCVLWLAEEKPRDFEPVFHWNWGTPLVVRDPDDVPRCASNPVFCKPFSFVQEAALWWDQVSAPHPRAATALGVSDVPIAEAMPGSRFGDTR